MDSSQRLNSLTIGKEKNGGETFAKKIFLDEVHTFGNNTTLHGFRYLVKTEASTLRRFLWLSVLLVTYVGLGYGLIHRMRKFCMFPTSTAMIINHAEEIVFPAATICNHNIVRRDHYPNNPNFTQFIRAISSGDGDNFDWAWYDQFLADDEWNLTETVIQGGHHLDEMILECTWQTYENCSAKNFTTTLTDFGVCYTFNADMNQPRTVSKPGSSFGLLLRMNVQQELYSFSEFSGAGLKVLVHPPNELPLVKMKGFSVPPGFATEISVKYIEITNLQHPYRPYCNDLPLKYSKVYTADLCRYECEVEEIIKECGCKDYRHPGDVRACDPREHFYCVLPVREYITTSGASTCICPEPCKRELYSPKISMAQWPSGYYREVLSNEFNITADYIRDNLLEINIYFEEMRYEKIIDSPAYEFFSFLGDVGGYLGLLCGASVVTLTEVLDCFLVTLSRIRSERHISSA